MHCNSFYGYVHKLTLLSSGIFWRDKSFIMDGIGMIIENVTTTTVDSILFKIRPDNWVLILQLIAMSSLAYMVGFLIILFVSSGAQIMQYIHAKTTVFSFQVCQCVEMFS